MARPIFRTWRTTAGVRYRSRLSAAKKRQLRGYAN